MKSRNSTSNLVGLAILTAIVVVLQLLGTYVKFGTFSVSLVLIPIVVGAAIYGPKAGAYLGFVFSVIVIIGCITGADGGGFILWSANWFLTVVLCLAKGTLAGLCAGLVYRALCQKSTYWGVAAAALVCPVVNTGIFLTGMSLFFHDTLVAWAGGTSLVYYIIFVLVGVNFLLELLANLICSPAIVRIIQIRRKA